MPNAAVNVNKTRIWERKKTGASRAWCVRASPSAERIPPHKTMVDLRPTETKWDRALREGVILPEQQRRPGSGAIAMQARAYPQDRAGNPIHNPKPRHFWEHAAGANPRYAQFKAESKNPFEVGPSLNPFELAQRLGYHQHRQQPQQQPPQYQQQAAVYQLPGYTSPPVAGINRARQEQQTEELERMSDKTSEGRRSMAAMTVAAGTVFGGAPDSDRSLGGFTSAIGLTPRVEPNRSPRKSVKGGAR